MSDSVLKRVPLVITLICFVLLLSCSEKFIALSSNSAYHIKSSRVFTISQDSTIQIYDQFRLSKKDLDSIWSKSRWRRKLFLKLMSAENRNAKSPWEWWVVHCSVSLFRLIEPSMYVIKKFYFYKLWVEHYNSSHIKSIFLWLTAMVSHRSGIGIFPKAFSFREDILFDMLNNLYQCLKYNFKCKW